LEVLERASSQPGTWANWSILGPGLFRSLHSGLNTPTRGVLAAQCVRLCALRTRRQCFVFPILRSRSAPRRSPRTARRRRRRPHRARQVLCHRWSRSAQTVHDTNAWRAISGATIACGSNATAARPTSTQLRGWPTPAASEWLSEPDESVFFQPRLVRSIQSWRAFVFRAEPRQRPLKTSMRSQLVVKRAGFFATPVFASRPM